MQYLKLGDVKLKNSIGERLPLSFLVKHSEVKQYQNGSGEYISIIMKDRNVEVEAKIWKIDDRIASVLKSGNVCDCLVDIKPYEKGKDGLSCILYSVELSERNKDEFIEWGEFINESRDTIGNALSVIENTVYGKIVNEILKSNWEKFSYWVAGRSMHHSALGELMVHSAGVARTALKLGQLYNSIYGDDFVDINLILAGSLIHDIGKLWELSVDKDSGNADYSVKAAMQNHLMFGVLEVERAATRLGIDPSNTEEVSLLQHVISAHHGVREWGALAEPSIPEAEIIHKADELDAQMYIYNKKLRELEPGDVTTSWLNGKARSIYKKIK